MSPPCDASSVSRRRGSLSTRGHKYGHVCAERGLPPRRRPQGWRACVSPLMRAHVSGPPADVAVFMATSTKTPYSGKQFWWSEHDPEYRELIDTRGRWDVGSTLGEWTRVECISNGPRLTIVVNGRTVNECFDAFPSRGKILLEAEGFEIFFRKFELTPLTHNA